MQKNLKKELSFAREFCVMYFFKENVFAFE